MSAGNTSSTNSMPSSSENSPIATPLIKAVGERTHRCGRRRGRRGADAGSAASSSSPRARPRSFANAVDVGDGRDHVLEHVRHRRRHLIVVKAHIHADLFSATDLGRSSSTVTRFTSKTYCLAYTFNYSILEGLLSLQRQARTRMALTLSEESCDVSITCTRFATPPALKISSAPACSRASTIKFCVA